MHRLVAAASPRLISLGGLLQHSNAHRIGRFKPPMLIKRKYYSKPERALGGIPMAVRRQNKLKSSREEDVLSHISWWREKMHNCRKPSSVELVKRLVYSNLLGLDSDLKNGRLKEGSLNSEMLQFKLRFPREVLLCRVGEFYEAIGFDACLLVEHAGLNPFGGLRSGSIPKAGCPVMNLRQTLDDLTRSGFSVCIVEEVQGPTHARSRKDRFISGHAHPGSPYVFGLAAADHDVDFPEPMPVVGISRSAKGYCMISVLETMKTFSAQDGLTEEAVVTKLRTCRYHHLFLHTSLSHNPSGTSRWGEFGEGGLLWGECRGKLFEWFDGNPIEAIMCKVREIYGLDPEAIFRNVTISSENRPQPLYLGTATQIGVIQTEGIPSLLKVLLPTNCVGLPILYLRGLLLNPPTHAVASAIQQACRLIKDVTCSIPDFTCVSSSKLVKLLETKEVNHLEFCRIKNIADEILQMHRNSELHAVLHALLEPAWIETGLKVDYQLLVKECDWISQRVSEIIFLDDEGGQETNSFEFVPEGFFEDIESSWKCRVKKNHAVDIFEEVDRAAESLSLAIMQDFVPVVSRVKSVVSAFGGPKGEICYAREHEAVWFKGKRFKPNVWADTAGEVQIKQLRPATDYKGRKVGEEWFTTSKVESALDRYHEANDKAKSKVLELLSGLSADIGTKINILIFSSMLLIIAKSLFSHVSEGRRREWALPTLYDSRKYEDKRSDKLTHRMEITGLSPYWLDAAQGSAIRNTVQMRSLVLLTGPNGGGKSSLLRSLCATALLGICGLMVPADSAIIPLFDSVMLHMKAYDSPSDGKSSFQIEMSELRSVVAGASPNSLVLVDEICRGTETEKGTCIAASIIEHLDQIGCLGFVSTHLHSIFELSLTTKNTVYKAMGTDNADGQIKPTWKLIDGICRESLAFETALKEGLPEKIIRRAGELYLTMHPTIVNTTEVDANKVRLYSEFHVHDPIGNNGSTSSGVRNSGLTMEQQEEVDSAVTVICQNKLIELYKKETLSEFPEVKCVPIGPREQPPPSTVRTSCIYILFRPDKKLYVGQTDDLAGRVRAHRSKEGMRNVPFIYVVVPGKSLASKLETLLINQLPLQGFQLVNKADGKHRNFGTSDLPLETLSLHQ